MELERKVDSLIHLILLSGGSGTRLWPLSNETRSKQFLKVLRDENDNHISMVQRVFSQIKKVNADLDITIATAVSQALSIEQQIKGDYSLVLEPERRDTAPAIMLSCAHLLYKQNVCREDTVIVMPIDTFADQTYYNKIPTLDSFVQDKTYQLVLLGVKPTYPSAKYGYIIPKDTKEDIYPVSCFVEKPNEDKAESLISKGALWNCGVFASRLGYITDILSKYIDAQSYEDVYNNYNQLPKISFDYEVVEKAKSVAVIPYKGTWKDLGTWNTLTEEMQESISGRVVIDDKTCTNTHVVNETGMPLVVSGIQDSVVVATHDGILVCNKEQSSNLKDLISKAAETRPMYEKRRWGEYRVIDYSVYLDGRKSLTKELIIEPDCQLSYQKHTHRSEVWTIVSGEGLFVLDGKVEKVEPGYVANISKESLHALKATTKLHLIEVQLGDKLEERDIERFGNYWENNQ